MDVSLLNLKLSPVRTSEGIPAESSNDNVNKLLVDKFCILLFTLDLLKLLYTPPNF